jgi:hypothetical protein
MRPLAHLGYGPTSEDYKLYLLDRQLYDVLSDRGDNILEDAKEKFMGHYYNNPPLPTLIELKENCDKWLNDKQHLEKLKAPKSLIDVAEENIIDLYQDIQNKKYGSMSDPVYKKYREAYFARENDWHNSQEKEQVLSKIYTYNEHEYNKIKQDENFLQDKETH